MLKTKVIEKIRSSKKIQELFNSNRLNYTSVNGYNQIIASSKSIKKAFKQQTFCLIEKSQEYTKLYS